jgi:hypothetical protein
MKQGVLHLFRQLIEYLHSFLARGAYIVVRADELPESIRPNHLYVLGEDVPWAVALICPCGCRDIIQLSLLEDDSPRWQLVSSSTRRPTLHPSIWRKRGCHSHFILRNGRIHRYRSTSEQND